MKKRDLGQIAMSGIDFVPRKAVGRFTNGLLSPRTLANLDCVGKGPRGRVRIGNQIAYPVTELMEWLEARTQRID